MAQQAHHIDVWRQYGEKYDWTISLAAADGTELKCLGAANDDREAFARACELADEYCVPAYLLGAGTEEPTRRYVPEHDD